MTLVDVHCHAAPEDIEELLRGMADVSLEGEEILVGNVRFPFPEALTSAPALAARLGPDGQAIVSPPPALFMYGLGREAAVDYVGRLNDGMVAMAERHERVRLLASLPLAYPKEAAEEVRRLAAASPLFVGAIVGTDPVQLGEKVMDGVWEALAAHQMSVFVHPNASCLPAAAGARAGPAVGFPIATTVSAVSLLLSDSAAWRVDSRICLAHGGGFLVAALPRLRRVIGDDSTRLDEHLRHFWVDGVLFDRAWQQLIADAVGEERMLPGSDWPFPLSMPDENVGGPERRPTQEIVERVVAWCPRFAATDGEGN